MRVRSSLHRAEALAIALLLLVATPLGGFAHERREVGKYQFVVGFDVEPAIQAEPNGAEIRVTVPSEGARAVENLADSLRVNIASGGGQPRDFPLQAVFGQPGLYVAHFIPTRPGAFIFTFSGSIEGMTVNERFESGPGRFDEVRAAEALQFPETIPPANEAVREARAASRRAEEAEAAVGQARVLAVGGVAVGGLGVVLSIVALALAARAGSQ